jgi:hypothetical protein
LKIVWMKQRLLNLKQKLQLCAISLDEKYSLLTLP